MQFLFQSAGRIAKALEDAVDARHIVVVALQAVVEIGGKFVVALNGACGNEQFVGIHGHRKAVVFVDGHHQSAAQTQVGGDEFAVVIAAEINLTADVRDVHAQAQLALALPHRDVVLIVKGEVGGKSTAGLGGIAIIIGEVGVDITHGSRDRKALAEHQSVAHIERHLVGMDGGNGARRAAMGQFHLAHVEITQ